MFISCPRLHQQHLYCAVLANHSVYTENGPLGRRRRLCTSARAQRNQLHPLALRAAHLGFARVGTT